MCIIEVMVSPNNEGGIPHIIHHMWFDKDPAKSNDQKPPSDRPQYIAYVLGWKEHHSQYKYMWWNGARINELWKDSRLRRWEQFFHKGLKQHIEKCDFSRYALLYLHGGLYVDLDFVCQKPLTSLLRGRDILFVEEPQIHTGDIDNGRKRVSNGIMGAVPNHWIFPLLMDYITKNYTPGGSVMLNTGPSMLAKFLEVYNIKQYPHSFVDTCLLLPLCGIEGKYQLSTECSSLNNAYAYTRYFEGTGWGESEKKPPSRMLDSKWLVVLLVVVAIVLTVRVANSKRFLFA